MTYNVFGGTLSLTQSIDHSVVLVTCADHAGNSCPQGCYGRGECVDGQCRCFTGYTGWNCKHSQYSLITHHSYYASR